MMHDSKLNQKAITWLASGRHTLESQSPFLSLLRRYPFFASATLHGGAIHRINKSLLPLLNVCMSRLKFSARGIVSIPSSQLSLHARDSAFWFLSAPFEQNSWPPIGNPQNENGIVGEYRYPTVTYEI